MRKKKNTLNEMKKLKYRNWINKDKNYNPKKKAA